MVNFMHFVLLLFILYQYSNQDDDETDEEKKVNQELEKQITAGCCPKDFVYLVLTKWENCMKMNMWTFVEHPLSVCRKEMFNKTTVCNMERKAKCTKRKNEWMDCIDRAVEKNEIQIKDKYKDNEKAIRGFPKEKLDCFRNAMADVKC